MALSAPTNLDPEVLRFTALRASAIEDAVALRATATAPFIFRGRRYFSQLEHVAELGGPTWGTRAHSPKAGATQ